jgi:hypothetical protein
VELREVFEALKYGSGTNGGLHMLFEEGRRRGKTVKAYVLFRMGPLTRVTQVKSKPA